AAISTVVPGTGGPMACRATARKTSTMPYSRRRWWISCPPIEPIVMAARAQLTPPRVQAQLHPALAAEEDQESHAGGHHAADPDHPECPRRPEQRGHQIAEVLAEEAGDEPERQEDRGDHG